MAFHLTTILVVSKFQHSEVPQLPCRQLGESPSALPQHILDPDTMLSVKEEDGGECHQVGSTRPVANAGLSHGWMDSLGWLGDQRSALPSLRPPTIHLDIRITRSPTVLYHL
jgi:hypothetical protein